MVEGYFQLQLRSLCLQGTAEASLLKGSSGLSFVAHRLPGPDFSGTVGELVDVLVEFVFPSESGVTCLSYPRLMTTHETVFNLQRIHLDLDAIPSVLLSFLCIKRWANDSVVICHLHWFASFCISCTRVLSADLRDTQVFQ